jgi:hypothetical protein
MKGSTIAIILGAVIIVIIIIIIIVLVFATGGEEESAPPSGSGAQTPAASSGSASTGSGNSATVAPQTAIAPAETAEDKRISAALAEVYGIYPHSILPRGSYAYGVIRATGAGCSAIGGAVNGYPGDDEWTDCHVNFGKRDDTSTAYRGFHSACPAGAKCSPIRIPMTSASDCRAIGGVPADDHCELVAGFDPTLGLYPRGTCPTGTCAPVMFRAQSSATCKAIGGRALDIVGNDYWPECHMNIGPAKR